MSGQPPIQRRSSQKDKCMPAAHRAGLLSEIIFRAEVPIRISEGLHGWQLVLSPQHGGS